jgi:hypothetical protein
MYYLCVEQFCTTRSEVIVTHLWGGILNGFCFRLFVLLLEYLHRHTFTNNTSRRRRSVLEDLTEKDKPLAQIVAVEQPANSD